MTDFLQRPLYCAQCYRVVPVVRDEDGRMLGPSADRCRCGGTSFTLESAAPVTIYCRRCSRPAWRAHLVEHPGQDIEFIDLTSSRRGHDPSADPERFRAAMMRAADLFNQQQPDELRCGQCKTTMGRKVDVRPVFGRPRKHSM